MSPNTPTILISTSVILSNDYYAKVQGSRFVCAPPIKVCMRASEENGDANEAIVRPGHKVLNFFSKIMLCSTVSANYAQMACQYE